MLQKICVLKIHPSSPQHMKLAIIHSNSMKDLSVKKKKKKK